MSNCRLTRVASRQKLHSLRDVLFASLSLLAVVGQLVALAH